MADLLEFGSLFPHPEGGVGGPNEIEPLHGDLVRSMNFDLIRSIADSALVKLLTHQVKIRLNPRYFVVLRELDVKGAKHQLSLGLFILHNITKLPVAANFHTILLLRKCWTLIHHLQISIDSSR